MTRQALALQHVAFETLGTFEAVLQQAGYQVQYHDVGQQDLSGLDPLAADLLVILGGPVGVYEQAAYPFLATEQVLIGQRLAAGKPTLGICLGAQQIAHALGARVAPGGVKEIGFAPLTLSAAGYASPLRHLDGVPVLHWHGDAFEVPAAGVALASTAVCPQAFAIGTTVLALQFHPEADTGNGLESWLIGHACELAAAGIDPNRLRAEAQQHGTTLREAGQRLLSEWLEALP